MTGSDEPFNKFRWNDHPLRVSLKGTANALATVMFNKANMDGTKVYGSQGSIAEMLGVTTKTVGRAQKQLESLGLIHREKTGTGFGRQSNEFVLTMPPIQDMSIEDMASSHVVSIEDISSIEDIDVPHTGHLCPPIEDTRVPPIDPLPDPGNKPGSVVLREPDTGGVRPRDPFAEGDIADVPQREDSAPIASHRLAVEERDNPYRADWHGTGTDPFAEPVPVSSQPSNPPSDADASSDPHKPANEETPPMSNTDPFALDAAAEAAMEAFYSKPAEQPKKPVDEFSRALQREYDNDEPQEPIRWPSGKPFVWGEFDPFRNYVDAETGEALDPHG